MVEAPDPTGASHRRDSLAVGLLASLACVALSPALIYPLRQITPPVSTASSTCSRCSSSRSTGGSGWASSPAVASAAAFNFFHIPPTGNLDIAKGENWVALAVFLAAAVLVSSLAEQSRARAREAEQRRGEANRAMQATLALLLDRERLQAATIETEALRRSDEVKTALLRAVSHDLRSPLTAIMAAGEALSSTRIERRRTAARWPRR